MGRGELERTRLDLQVPARREEYPPGTRMLQGNRRDLEEHMSQVGARAVGVWRKLPGGGTQVPVVYVSKRAEPWVVRHRIALLATGVPMLVASLLALGFLWVGPVWMVGGMVAAVVFVATIVRWSRGGQRGGNITVNVNTNVRGR